MIDFTNTHFVDETLLTRYHQNLINFLSDTYLNKSGGTMNGQINTCAILPKATETYDLGSSTYKWNNIYGKNIYQNGSQVALKSEVDSAQTAADNAAATANNALPKTGGTMMGNINSQSILPKSTNTYDLGSSSYAWKTGYINAVVGQLIHNSNASWNGLAAAAVYSGVRSTNGVNYLWGCASKTSNKWIGIGELSDTVYFTFFNNNLQQNEYLNALGISADANGVYLGSSYGKVYINGSVGMGASNTSNTTSQGKWHNGIKFSNGLIINWGMSSVFSAGNQTDSQYFSYNFTSGTSYVTIATPYRSSASFTWVTVSSQAASYVNLTSNSFNNNNWCTQYFWVAIGY